MYRSPIALHVQSVQVHTKPVQPVHQDYSQETCRQEMVVGSEWEANEEEKNCITNKQLSTSI